MVTNYPPKVTHRSETSTPRDADGFSATVVQRLRQVLCGVHGHDSLLRFERDRLSLRCVSCGYESPGWELTETPPTPAVREDVRRQPLRPQLVGARRIA